MRRISNNFIINNLYYVAFTVFERDLRIMIDLPELIEQIPHYV